MLYGRGEETAEVERLLRRAREGRSGVLVVRGEAGIGKSALLDHAAALAASAAAAAAAAAEGRPGMRVLRATGVEAEAALPYAALHLLLGRHLDRVDALPHAQARALGAALGLTTDPAADAAAGHERTGDRFLVGLAVLTLLADLAEERPLLVLADDAHWFDRASADALLFAARRLDAEPIALLFAARDLDAPEFPAPGLPELRLAGLDDGDAAALLADHAAELPRHVHTEILAEAKGNPLALLELPSARRAPSAPGGAATSTSGRLRRAYAERIAALPEATRTALLVAAADGTGDVAVVVPTLERLGVSVADLEPAERDGLVRSAEGGLEFRHPLIRTAVYEGATLSRRMDVHRALAATHIDRGDVCHRAWHLAHAAAGPDEETARALEEAATGRAPVRAAGAPPARDAVNGSASIAAMLERAADLSPGRADRVRRLAAAARAAADAGLAEQATTLADRVAAETSDPIQRADMVRLRGVLADEQDRTAEAYRLFSDTADSVADTAPDLAGYLVFQAASAAANAGDFAALERAVARAESLGLPNVHLVRALARMYAGQDAFTEGRSADGARAGRELLDGMGLCIGPREVTRAAWLRLLLGDVEGAHEAAAGLAERLRDQGAIGLLSTVLPLLARTHLLFGRHRDALATATEGMRIAEDIGQHRHRVYHKTVLALLAAIEGDEDRCAELAAEPLERGVAPGDVHAAGALSLLDLGLGRYEPALNRLLGVVSGPRRQGAIASLPDLVEAAVRAGRPDDGRDAAAWYADWAAHVGRPWARAVALRCQALLEPEEQAGKAFADAVELHREGGPPFERARTELLYGEWLRRARRRNDARAHLHAALETFERLGAAPWADRARGELRAAGESLTGAAPDGRAELLARLTPQELQVVRLAATGLSNREIGARLFLSPRTVGYHLYKAYPKLGVASRAELARLNLD